MEKPAFSRHIFWDKDYDKIDWVENDQYVIERVVDYGRIEDWKLLKQVYRMDRIKEVVMNARFLNKKTTNFFSLLLNEPIANFRYFEEQKMNQIGWCY